MQKTSHSQTAVLLISLSQRLATLWLETQPSHNKAGEQQMAAITAIPFPRLAVPCSKSPPV